VASNCMAATDAGAVPVIDEIGTATGRVDVDTKSGQVAAPDRELLRAGNGRVDDGLGKPGRGLLRQKNSP
jgi:hypothetical protein